MWLFNVQMLQNWVVDFFLAFLLGISVAVLPTGIFFFLKGRKGHDVLTNVNYVYLFFYTAKWQDKKVHEISLPARQS